MSKRDSARHLMNEPGTRREPFLFGVDFEMNDPVVLPVQQAEDSGILYESQRSYQLSCSSKPTDAIQNAFRRHLRNFQAISSYAECNFAIVFEQTSGYISFPAFLFQSLSDEGDYASIVPA